MNITECWSALYSQAKDAGLDTQTGLDVANGKIALDEALGDMDMNAESATASPVGIDRSGREYNGVAIRVHDGKEWKPLRIATQEDMDMLFYCGCNGSNGCDDCIPF